MGQLDVFTASTGEVPVASELDVVDLACAGDEPGPCSENLQVVGSIGRAGLRVQMLPGRDVLDACLLVYDGPNRRVSLAYDSPASRPDG